MKSIDYILIFSVVIILAYAGYHLYANKVFDPNGLGETILMILAGHGAHEKIGAVVDSKYGISANQFSQDQIVDKPDNTK